MDLRFAALTEELHASFERLQNLSPIVGGRLPPDCPEKAVYLFSEGSKHLYVGRTNHLRKRYRAHTSQSSKEKSAAFAMLLSRLETGRKASYRAGPDSRKGLMSDDAFVAIFERQKARIREMDFRYVEETRPLQQTLLEVYCAVVLETPFNDFDNH